MNESLPVGWHDKPILEVVSLPRGQVMPTEEPFKSQVLIAPDHIEPTTGRVLAYETAAEQGAISGKYQVEPGDVLLSKIRPALRKVAHSEVFGLCSADIYPLHAGPELHSKYLFSVLLGARFGRFSEALSGRSGIPKINRKELAEFRIPLPSLREQRRIGEILDSVDESIRSTECILAKRMSMKDGLLQALFMRGIDNEGLINPDCSEAPERYRQSQAGQIPADWSVHLLDELAERGSGHTPSKDMPSYWNGGIKWVSLADSAKLDHIYIHSTAKEVSQLGIANSSAVLHARMTVILSRDAGVGKSAILADDMAVSQHFIAWKCGDLLSPHYLYYWLQFNKRMFESIAFGSTIKTIGLGFFKRLKIAVPSPAKQQAAVANLLYADSLNVAVEAELTKLRKIRAALMDDLLTGRVRVKTERA